MSETQQLYEYMATQQAKMMQQAPREGMGAYQNALQNVPGLTHGPKEYANAFPTAFFEFTAGRAIRRPFREMLEEKKMKGLHFSWVEQKRFLNSRFMMTGSPAAVDDIKNTVKRMAVA